MKSSKYVQCILCEGDTFQGAVDRFNEEMKRLAQLNPTYERAGDKFLIYVDLYEEIPETIAEAKHLEGCRHTCKDCEYCERELNRFGTVDKRRKKAMCAATGSATWIDSEVCDTFYLEHMDERKEA